MKKYLLSFTAILLIFTLANCSQSPTGPSVNPTVTPMSTSTPTTTPTPFPSIVWIKSVVKSPTISESVMLNNNTGVVTDISGWTLGDVNNPTAKTFATGTMIGIGQDLIIQHSSLGFQINDINESIYLKNSVGDLIYQWDDVRDPTVHFSVYIFSVTASPTENEQVILKNNDMVTKDLSQWTIGDLNDPNAYCIPNNTILEVDQTLTFPRTTLGFQINDSNETIYLKDSTGQVVDTWSN